MKRLSNFSFTENNPPHSSMTFEFMYHKRKVVVLFNSRKVQSNTPGFDKYYVYWDIAICSPVDKYDINIALGIIFKRLSKSNHSKVISVDIPIKKYNNLVSNAKLSKVLKEYADVIAKAEVDRILARIHNAKVDKKVRKVVMKNLEQIKKLQQSKI